jgi:hypothetical protein
MIGFHFNRSIPTTLKLNGPTLAYLTQPVDTSESITGFATFTGIATATYPSSPGDIIEGTFEFHWYLDNTEIFNSSGVAIVSSGNISTCTFSNMPSTSDGKLVKIITDYIPGTNESNAINDDLNSDEATLTLIPDIEIITQPQSVEVAAGSDAIFSVDAQLKNGTTEGLAYQWYLNNQPITDGASSGYTYSGSGTDTLTVDIASDVSLGGAAICISVIDESSPAASTIEQGWNSFRSNYPQRPFWLLQPTGYTPDSLKIPNSYLNDPLAYYPQTVNRDNGNSGSASDWFNMCNLSQAAPGTSISISIDNSGSTTVAQVQASLDLFLSKCSSAGLVVYQVDMSGEEWAPPHNRYLPESNTASDKDIYVEVSHPQSFNSPLNSNTVTLSIVAPRPIIKYEAYTFDNQYQSLDIDFNNNSSYTLDGNTFGSNYSITQFHSTEKNNILNIEMYASKGTNNGGYSGGNGGLSTIKFTAVKDIEYTLIGISNNSSLFLYRGSNLIACVGAGGNAGTSGNGGDGGGINIPGSDGGGRQGGVGGTKINTGTLSLSGTYGSIYQNSGIELYPGDSVANSPDGGKTISCTKGSYWIDQGIAPCSDNSSSDIKFVNVDGTTIAGSSLVKRGFKPGYTISNTSGLEINNGGRGGSGATGGGGGTSGSGGGGGSGYTDGSIIVTTAVLGGSTGSSKVVMRVEDTEFIHFFDNTVRPRRTTSLTGTGNIVNISAQSENSGGPPGDLNSKHYLITMDADYTGLTIEVISDLTAAGGSSDPDMTAASIQKQNSTQWRVWFVRGNGTSNTFVREASIIGNV